MKHYRIVYPDQDGETVVEVLSEASILHIWRKYWYEKMCHKFGRDYVDKNYTDQDCISDWVVGNWASIFPVT
jgi:hypothetical protein